MSGMMEHLGWKTKQSFLTLLEAAFGDPGQVSITGQMMQDIKPMNTEFSQYYAESQVIAADHNCNHLALRNAQWMVLSEEMKNSFTCSHMLEEHCVSVMVCQKRDHHIRQWRMEQVAHITAGWLGFAPSSRLPTPPKDPVVAQAGMAAGYTGPVTLDPSSGKRRISAEERVKRCAHEMCLYCGRMNYRVVECMARKETQTCNVTGEEVKQLGTRTCAKEFGNDWVSHR